MKVLIGFDLLLAYILRQDDIEGLESLFSWIDKIGMKKYADKGSIMLLTHFIPIDDFSRFHGFEYLDKEPSLPSYQAALLFSLNNALHEDEKLWGRVLLMQLNQLIEGNIDYLITDNNVAQRISEVLGIEERVYSVEDFLERCALEYRELDKNKGIVIQKLKMGQLDINDSFFDSFKKDYSPYYECWFQQKMKDPVYVAYDNNKIKALLKLKEEYVDEDYSDIIPSFSPCTRLKICSMKVDYTGEKLGQRFLHIIFMEALEKKVDEIYVTIVNNSSMRRRLINLLEFWGFKYYGKKNYREEVYVRKMIKNVQGSPFFYYPFQALKTPTFIIPIGNNYSRELLPPFYRSEIGYEIEPYKAAIRKVMVLKDAPLELGNGCNLLFYQINNYSQDKSRIIASGIVNNVRRNFLKKEDFIRCCRKRSILSLNALTNMWNQNKDLVVVEFLYNYSFEDEKNIISSQILRKANLNIEILASNQALEIDHNQFLYIISNTIYEKNIIAN